MQIRYAGCNSYTLPNSKKCINVHTFNHTSMLILISSAFHTQPSTLNRLPFTRTQCTCANIQSHHIDHTNISHTSYIVLNTHKYSSNSLFPRLMRNSRFVRYFRNSLNYVVKIIWINFKLIKTISNPHFTVFNKFF